MPPTHAHTNPLDPPALPVEPDEGPQPPPIPQDPEHDRVIDPAAPRTRPVLHTRHWRETSSC